MGYPLRVAAAAGLSLAQIGEFSFVLSRSGVETGLLGRRFDQIFLATAVVTMALTAWLHRAGLWAQSRSGHLASWRLPFLNKETPTAPAAQHREDHVVIVGYGMNGRNLSRVLASVGIAYVAVEMNPFTVRAEREKNLPILYGDATDPETLAHAGLAKARVLVIARTRYVQEVGPLLSLGAHLVIPEEFETSVEIFAQALHPLPGAPRRGGELRPRRPQGRLPGAPRTGTPLPVSGPTGPALECRPLPRPTPAKAPETSLR